MSWHPQIQPFYHKKNFRLVRHDLLFVNLCWLFLVTFSMCLEMCSKSTCSRTFPVTLMSLQEFSKSSCCIFLKMGANLSFFLLSRTFFHLYYFTNIAESSLVKTPASPLSSGSNHLDCMSWVLASNPCHDFHLLLVLLFLLAQKPGRPCWWRMKEKRHWAPKTAESVIINNPSYSVTEHCHGSALWITCLTVFRRIL